MTAALAIAVLALYPNLKLPEPDVIRSAEVIRGSTDLIYHSLAFSTLFVLGAVGWGRLWRAGVAVFAYSIALEALQIIVPGREVHWEDAAANATGVLVGAALVVLWRQGRRLYGAVEVDA